MKANKWFLLFFNFMFFGIILAQTSIGGEIKKYCLVTKIGKSDCNVDRLRFFAEDKLLLLDKKKSLISYWRINEKNYTVIDNISKPIDFDYSSGSIYLLFGDSSQLKKWFVSPNANNENKNDYNNPIIIDSVFNLNRIFQKPASISVDKYNRYIVVADTGSINSINIENKVFSLKFLNYRPGDIVFDSYSRSVYSSDFTTKSLVKISVEGKLEQLISNYDSNDPFVLDSKGNVIILDKKNDVLAKLTPQKNLSILLEKASGALSLAVHRECDTIIYMSNKINEIFRIDIIPDETESVRNIVAVKQNEKVGTANSVFMVSNGKSKKYYYYNGNKCQPDDNQKIIIDRAIDSSLSIVSKTEVTKTGFKKSNPKTEISSFKWIGNEQYLLIEKYGKEDILSRVVKNDSGYIKNQIATGEFISNLSVASSEEYLIINKFGMLVKIKSNGEQKILAQGLSGFKKILFSGEEFCYVLNEKGELLKVDAKKGKSLISKKISFNSEIFQSSLGELILRDRTKISILK